MFSHIITGLFNTLSSVLTKYLILHFNPLTVLLFILLNVLNWLYTSQSYHENENVAIATVKITFYHFFFTGIISLWTEQIPYKWFIGMICISIGCFIATSD